MMREAITMKEKNKVIKLIIPVGRQGVRGSSISSKVNVDEVAVEVLVDAGIEMLDVVAENKMKKVLINNAGWRLMRMATVYTSNIKCTYEQLFWFFFSRIFFLWIFSLWISKTR
jgi:hypothetical protein